MEPPINFGETILGLQRKREALQEERNAIDRQLEVIDQTIESLLFLGNPESRMPLPRNLNELGLQDAVRSIFRRSYPFYLLPTEVRETLVSAGTFGPSSKNLLISVHTAISRMKAELEEESRPGGKTAYRWKEGMTIKNAYEQALDAEKKREKPWVNLVGSAVKRSPLETAMQRHIPHTKKK